MLQQRVIGGTGGLYGQARMELDDVRREIRRLEEDLRAKKCHKDPKALYMRMRADLPYPLSLEPSGNFIGARRDKRIGLHSNRTRSPVTPEVDRIWVPAQTGPSCYTISTPSLTKMKKGCQQEERERKYPTLVKIWEEEEEALKVRA